MVPTAVTLCRIDGQLFETVLKIKTYKCGKYCMHCLLNTQADVQILWYGPCPM